MSYLDHDGLAYFKSKLDRTFIADIVFDDGDILLYGGDGTLLKTVVQEGTVTQKKSTTNKEYPILLCWDADAEEDQTMKTVWYGLDARINPKFGYLYARRYYTEHPSYERTNAPTVRTEWHHMFTDAVSAPMGEVYEYLDRNSDGGEHRMELRLYGNPLSQYVDTPNHNEATDAVSIGVGATRGDTLTFFGYCPSTPIYLENGSTMRKSTVRGDQYGKDIITRDWLNLNGSITGLVHTYMDETIDGYKTFLKTVTIDSGNDNAKAGLNVQGDVNIDSGDASKPSNFYVQGNSHIHGNEDIDGNLNVDGTSDQHGNVHMYHNLDVDGNANTDGNQTVGGTLTVTGKITGNGGAEISGGSGLKVNGNETVTGNLTVGGTTTTEDLTVNDDATIGDDLNVNGDANVAGTINKKTGNTTQEYVTYVTNQADTRKNIAAGLVDTTKGLAYNSSTGKIYVNANTNKGIGFDSNGKIYVDFSQIDENTKASILDGLNIQIPLTGNKTLIVDSLASNRSDSFDLDFDTRIATPFEHIQKAVTWASSKLALGTYKVYIKIKGNTEANPRVYTETVRLPEVNASSGFIQIETYSGDKDVLINTPATDSGHHPTIISANAGSCFWVLKHLVIEMILTPTTASGVTISGIETTTEGARIYVYGCTIKTTISGTPSSGNSYAVYSIKADQGGEIRLYPDDKGSKLIFAKPTTITNGSNIYTSVLQVSRNGHMYFVRATNSENGDYSCQGTCDDFINCNSSAGTNLFGGTGTQIAFVVPSGQTVTGNSFKVQSGSYIIAPASDFPGQVPSDLSTVIEYGKACWVSGL